MKLIIREYLASLKERDELDAILPSLLSELGFTVLSRPRRGTTQRGVDVAAVGPDEDGEKKLFLFSIKPGDLSRQDWDGDPQALRPSLNEILDVYIPARISKRYSDLRIVICMCFGGEVHEQIRDSVTGYIANHTTDKVSFDEWNGDKIAGLMLQGILREEILPKRMRSSFQKAVAMVDEPDVAYEYFAQLAKQLQASGGSSARVRIRTARQLYICLWILYVWARDVDNIEAPYRASELAILHVWNLLRPLIRTNARIARSLSHVLHQLIMLHLTIALELIDRKVSPHSKVPHGLSMACSPQAALDVNLALFEMLGRVAITGLWLDWLESRSEQPELKGQSARRFTEVALEMIANNPALHLPICDRQATDMVLLLMLWAMSGQRSGDIAEWLSAVTMRMDYAMRTRGRYPAVFVEYRELADHPSDKSDEYFQKATAGSTLIPVIAAWLSAIAGPPSVERLRGLAAEKLQHCTMQLWIPGSDSEDHLYLNTENHGRALCDLSVSDTEELVTTVAQACAADKAFDELSAARAGYWPVILTACRHYRLPVPPNFWIHMLSPPVERPPA